jgi:hypothetical protein
MTDLTLKYNLLDTSSLVIQNQQKLNQWKVQGW